MVLLPLFEVRKPRPILALLLKTKEPGKAELQRVAQVHSPTELLSLLATAGSPEPAVWRSVPGMQTPEIYHGDFKYLVKKEALERMRYLPFIFPPRATPISNQGAGLQKNVVSTAALCPRSKAAPPLAPF